MSFHCGVVDFRAVPGLEADNVAYVDLQLRVEGFATQQVSRATRDRTLLHAPHGGWCSQ